MANLILNPGFETDSAGANPPTNWGNFNAPGNIVRAVATDEFYAGSKSWKINTTDGNTADCGLLQSASTRVGGSTITVLPNTEYRFSNYIKTQLTTGQAHVHIKLFEAGYANESGYDTPNVTGTTDWTLNEYVFTTGASDVIFEAWLCFGAYGAAANGIAWFDEQFLDVTAPPAVVQDVLGRGIIPFPR